MDIDSLTDDEKSALVEGFFMYPLPEGQSLDNTLLALIEWHETPECKLLKGLEHWAWNTGPHVIETGYDYQYRRENLFNQ